MLSLVISQGKKNPRFCNEFPNNRFHAQIGAAEPLWNSSAFGFWILVSLGFLCCGILPECAGNFCSLWVGGCKQTPLWAPWHIPLPAGCPHEARHQEGRRICLCRSFPTNAGWIFRNLEMWASFINTFLPLFVKLSPPSPCSVLLHVKSEFLCAVLTSRASEKMPLTVAGLLLVPGYLF